MPSAISIHPSSKPISATINLPLSKSISNRIALLYALAGKPVTDLTLSDARDTQLLIKALSTHSAVIDVEDAGTVMRFMLAYAALRGTPCLIKGTQRMHERPIAPLVESLRALGANLIYKEKEGYPPVEILPGQLKSPLESLILKADVSSQFVSAILMIAPLLPQGLKFILEGQSVSSSYIDMTVACMQQFGIVVDQESNHFNILPQKYQPKLPIAIEADWSSAAFFFSLCALVPGSQITFPSLSLQSIQGDTILPKLFSPFGVATSQSLEGVLIVNTGKASSVHHEFNFIQCPDLAQSWIFTSAALGHSCKATGLDTLPRKETQRISAIAETLEIMGIKVSTDLTTYLRSEGKAKWDSQHVFQTYRDHRMAMSLAVLGAVSPLNLEDAEVVQKSYPTFWDAIAETGLGVGAGLSTPFSEKN